MSPESEKTLSACVMIFATVFTIAALVLNWMHASEMVTLLQ